MKFSRGFLLVWAGVAVFVLVTLPAVPFHPDETSFLTMASDWEAFWRAPLSLAWEPGQPQTRAEEYRLLNAPLAKLVFGAALALAGEPVPAVDWDWTKNWEENVTAGALPAENALLAGRLASTLLTLAALPFIYMAGRELGGERSGLAAAFLFGLHPVVLLHGRRAMAEGTMLFCIALALWLLLRAGRAPGWAGLAGALATLSKFSPAAILPALGLAALWRQPWDGGRAALGRGLRFGLALGLTGALLMPILWKHPLEGLRAMAAERRELLASTVALTRAAAPGRVMDTVGERALGLLAQLFVLPPAVSDVGNYDAELAESSAAYLALWPHSWGRGLAGGALMLGLLLFGVIRAGLLARQMNTAGRRRLVLLALASALQAGALLLTIPIAYQRYYLPLLPMAVLWMGLAFGRARGDGSETARMD